MATYEVIIIGSGFSGICSAIKLQEEKIDNFLILEKDEELGGTWWRNSYPGAAVDVPSSLYSFSFEKYDWTRLFAKQEEILAYTKQIISKYQLESKARKNVSIAKIVFNQGTSSWQIKLINGETLQSKFVISATGGLSQASIPKIEGLESFKGTHFHSSKWNHDFDFRNKSVAVIGTGASAVQLVPELAKKVKHLHVMQRTPHWILPRPDRLLKNWERKLLKIPFINKIFRGITYLKSESRAIFFTKIPALAKLVSLEAKFHLKKQVKDEKLRAKLSPNYAIGCKRILLTNDYYPALCQKNVSLETESIDKITTKGLLLKNGTELSVDLIVFATGFHAAENAIPFDIIGKNSLSIHQHWKDGAFAYYGTTLNQFPNLFFGMGPNTGTGHTSVIYFIESQMNYIIDAILKAKQNEWATIEIKQEVENEFNTSLQRKLQNTIWQQGQCNSWYLTKSGKNTTMFPNFSFIFRNGTKSFQEALHNVSK